MKVDIIVFDGFDELDAIAPYEVFRMAAARGADIEARLVTINGSEDITGFNGLTIKTTGICAADCDLLVVTGGAWLSGAETGIRGEIVRGEILDLIRDHHKRGGLLAAVCTGTMALQASGVLDGRIAVTHREALAELANSDTSVVYARVVDDGDIISCGGVTAATSLALHVVRRFFGEELHDQLIRRLDHIPVGHTHLTARVRPTNGSQLQ